MYFTYWLDYMIVHAEKNQPLHVQEKVCEFSVACLSDTLKYSTISGSKNMIPVGLSFK